MSKFIVVTTIYPVSQALRKFVSFQDWNVIIVGDTKTPHKDYYALENENRNVQYMNLDYQEKHYKDISTKIGFKSIQRRNLGFLEALRRGAEIIASVDDDNVPFDDWGSDLMIGKPVNCYHYVTEDTCFDPVCVAGYPELWHRGYPLQTLKDRRLRYNATIKTVVPDIQASFWNGDPDIDSVCRFEHKPTCFFDDKYFPFTSNAFSPFNSQNTFFSRNAMCKYLVLSFVGRMDDIWAGYYTQALGFEVVYTRASVFQDRNVQNLTKNFKDECIGYENTLDLLGELKHSNKDANTVLAKFVPKDTMDILYLYQKAAQTS